MAAKSELEDRSSSESARHLFLRALRFHPNNKKVYQEVKQAKFILTQSLTVSCIFRQWNSILRFLCLHDWSVLKRGFWKSREFSNISVLVLSYGAAALWETEEAEGRAGEGWDGPGECVTNWKQTVGNTFSKALTLYSVLKYPFFTPSRVNMSFL